ncbi:MAG: 16S rRNA (guanine(527)-N(7))-methyltransferase RsmG [Pseudomonadota bacterium]|nr:16S rRNA (guanine(527)-N(7))-methyltransferase RsmG [Pseudomonadota bacterium]
MRASAVSRETIDRLTHFEALVRHENERQNLVSTTTLDQFGVRHLDDAAQLVELAPGGQSWCDVGSGAGLPGIVIALMTGDPMTLIEPRGLRADFLRRACASLQLVTVNVVQLKAERTVGQFDVITARAVAETDKLFEMTEHLAHSSTKWILPKGRSAKKELEAARQSWQGEFRLVPSRTSDEGQILVAEQVRRRCKR